MEKTFDVMVVRVKRKWLAVQEDKKIIKSHMLLTDNFLTTSKYWYSGWEKEEVKTE